MLHNILIINAIPLNLTSKSIQWLILFSLMAAICFKYGFKKMGAASVVLAIVFPAIMNLFGQYTYSTELMQSYGIHLPFHEISNYIPSIAIVGVVLCALLNLGNQTPKYGGKAILITIGMIFGLILMRIIELFFFIRLLDSSQVIVVEFELGIVLVISLIEIIKRRKKKKNEEKGMSSVTYKKNFPTQASFFRCAAALLLFVHIVFTFLMGNIYFSILVVILSIFVIDNRSDGKLLEMIQDFFKYVTSNVKTYLVKLKNSKAQSSVEEISTLNNATFDNNASHTLDETSGNIVSEYSASSNNIGNFNSNTENINDGDDIFELTVEFFDFNPEDENSQVNESRIEIGNICSNGINENPSNITPISLKNDEVSEIYTNEEGYNQVYGEFTSKLKIFIVKLFSINRIELGLEGLEIVDCIEKVCSYFNNFSYLNLPDIDEYVEKLKVLDKLTNNHGNLSEDLINGAESTCLELKQAIIDSLNIIINDSKFIGVDV